MVYYHQLKPITETVLRSLKSEQIISAGFHFTDTQRKIYFLTQYKVYEGIPIMLAWQSIPLGGKAIHR